jgi:RHS repeat-associated protein
MSYVYDADGNAVLATDALGHTQTTSYYSDERVDQVAAQPSGSLTHMTTYSYDANGNQTAVVDSVGSRTSSTYTADNLMSSTTDGAGDTTSYVYDPAGNAIGVYAPSANAKDANNSGGVPAVYTYTANNLLASMSIPIAASGNTARETNYAYDAGGRKVTETTTLVSSASPSQVVQACVPAANQCTSVGLPVPTATGGAQQTLSFSYYNDDRLQTQSVSSTGDFITDQYDAAGDLTGSSTSNSATNLGAGYYFDGSPRTVNDGKWTTEYTYDGAGSIAARAQEQDGTSNTYTTTYAYGDSELPTSVTSSIAGGSTSVSYDAAGRPSQERDPNGETLTWSFNPDDTLASLQLATSGSSSFATWSYTYDGDYRQLSQTLAGGGATATGTLGYQYDGAGHLTSFSVPGTVPYTAPYAKTITVNHDGDRLTFGNESFTYNADDSIATANDGATPTSHTFGFQYGMSGQLLNDGCATYAYDGFNRLASYSPHTSTAGCPTSVSAATYSYDGLDRLRSGGSAPSINYDGLNLNEAVETSTASGGYTGLYELTPSGQPIAVTSQSAGSAQYLVDDGQGNVSGVMSSSQGAVCAVRYDAFGGSIAGQSTANPCNNSGGSSMDTLFYRGERLDPASGNYTLGSRTYNPSTDQFLTPDSYRSEAPAFDLSIGVDPLTLDRYVAMNGDPVNLVDPTGHCFDTGTGYCPTPCEVHGTCYSPPPNPCLTGGCVSQGGGGATIPSFLAPLSPPDTVDIPDISGGAFRVAGGAELGCAATAEIPGADVGTCGIGQVIAGGAAVIGAGAGLFAWLAAHTGHSTPMVPPSPGPCACPAQKAASAIGAATSANDPSENIGGEAQRAEFARDSQPSGPSAVPGSSSGGGGGPPRSPLPPATASPPPPDRENNPGWSPLFEPGPFAQGSVPSSRPGFVSASEQQAVNELGDHYGCHSCGANEPGTKSGNWIGDHQPVSRWANGRPQQLYPHCLACSSRQGLDVINAIRLGFDPYADPWEDRP